MGLHKYLEEKQNKKTSLKAGGIIQVSQHILISVQIYAAGRSKNQIIFFREEKWCKEMYCSE